MPPRNKSYPPRRHSKPLSPETGWRSGSVGSARIWDERARNAHRSGLPMPPPLPPPAPPPAPEPPPEPAAPQPVAAASVPEPAPPPAPMPELCPRGLALLEAITAQVPEIETLPGLRHALATLISRSDLAPSAATAGPSTRAKELDLLRRRAGKLVRELRTARSEVERAAALEMSDPGVASLYREVQGLREESADAEAKRGMLEDIFRANLELRREAG